MKRLLFVVLAALFASLSVPAFAADILVEKTMTDACKPDTNTVANPTAQAITALGTNLGACLEASGWASGTNFTNGYRSVRLGKQNRDCDSEINLQSKTALQPGENKVKTWTCNSTPCTAGDGKLYYHCAATVQ